MFSLIINVRLKRSFRASTQTGERPLPSFNGSSPTCRCPPSNWRPCRRGRRAERKRRRRPVPRRRCRLSTIAIREGEVAILDAAGTEISATAPRAFGELNLLSADRLPTAVVTKQLRYIVDRGARALLFDDGQLRSRVSTFISDGGAPARPRNRIEIWARSSVERRCRYSISRAPTGSLTWHETAPPDESEPPLVRLSAAPRCNIHREASCRVRSESRPRADAARGGRLLVVGGGPAGLAAAVRRGSEGPTR